MSSKEQINKNTNHDKSLPYIVLQDDNIAGAALMDYIKRNQNQLNYIEKLTKLHQEIVKQ